MSKLFKHIVGSVLIIVGIVALFLPIIPGGVLVYLGLQLLGITFFRDRFPVWKEKLKVMVARLRNPGH